MEIDKLEKLCIEFTLALDKLNWTLLKEECPGAFYKIEEAHKVERVGCIGENKFVSQEGKGLHSVKFTVEAIVPGPQHTERWE